MWIMNVTLHLVFVIVVMATADTMGASSSEQDLSAKNVGSNEGGGDRGSKGPQGAKKKGVGTCRRRDKATLNNNLINMFHTEYLRYFGRDASSDASVVAWKFRRLDADGDRRLERREYRDLRRVARKAARPKRCSRSFPKRCDSDGDAAISREEWASCLSVRRQGAGAGGIEEDSEGGGGGAGSSSSSSEEESAAPDADEEDYGEEDASPTLSYHQTMMRRPPPHGVLSSERTTPLDGRHDASASEDPDGDADDATDEPTDCLSDRRAAMSEGVGGVASQLYVPECTPDGRYQKVQCYRSAGYCWCVDETTGRNIPGTSVKGATPRCDPPPNHAQKMTPPAWKGCPKDERKWTEFMRELVGFLEGSAPTEGGAPSLAISAPALRHAFARYDVDGDNAWGRSERKRFREAIAEHPGGRGGALRRCGRRLPRYCDADADGRLTVDEWTACLTEDEGRRWKGGMLSAGAIPGSSSPRAGKINPLSMLKDD